MKKFRNGFGWLSISAAMAGMVIVCCGSDDSKNITTTENSGILKFAISGLDNEGNEYRLRNAVFNINGASSAILSSENFLNQQTVNQALRTGQYQIELDSGWRLERKVSDVYDTVDAELVSSNPVAFTIQADTTTRVGFRFEADSEVVNVGWGNMEVSIDVSQKLTLQRGVRIVVDEQHTNGNPTLVSGDLNGDSWPDIALSHGYAGGAIILNQQNEMFSPEMQISESWWDAETAHGATNVNIADLDLDGNLDYIFPIHGADYSGKSIQLYKGDGNGHFSIPTGIPNGLINELNGTNPMGCRVADFDHNGLPDIAVGNNNGSQSVEIILQTSPWVFSPSFSLNQNSQANPQWCNVADLNNDGWMDLVIPFLYGTVEVYLNTANGTGSLTYAGGYLSAFNHQVTTADFNGDGFIDIAARNCHENRVTILYNNGAGVFSENSQTAPLITSGTSEGRMESGDLNGDGRMDLVVCSSTASTLDVFQNEGNGAFRLVDTITYTEQPLWVTLNDFDRDGDLDIAVYTSNHDVSSHIQMLWNR